MVWLLLIEYSWQCYWYCSIWFNVFWYRLFVNLCRVWCVLCFSLPSHKAMFSSQMQSWVRWCVPRVLCIHGTLLFRKLAKSYFLTSEMSQNLVSWLCICTVLLSWKDSWMVNLVLHFFVNFYVRLLFWFSCCYMLVPSIHRHSSTETSIFCETSVHSTGRFTCNCHYLSISMP